MNRFQNHSAGRRAGLLNLTLAAAVGLLAWFSWWILQEKPAPVAVQRSFTELRIPWQCSAGHQYEANGALSPQPCPECGAEAYPIASYRCTEHGALLARLRHEQADDGSFVLSAISFVEDEWIPRPPELRCPYCGLALRSVPPDPFAKLRKEDR